MKWAAYASSAIGGFHQKHSYPCQDHSMYLSATDYAAGAVADGHGNRRHFRSETGSSFACEAARECLRTFCEKRKDTPTESELYDLGSEILFHWRALVMTDVQTHPWTEAELAEQQRLLTQEEYALLCQNENVLIPYGTTLVVGAASPAWWFVFQIGDGEAALLDCQGCFHWPTPEGTIHPGNKTASLCMNDPMGEFRCKAGNEPIAGMVLYTDGIEKAFPAHSPRLAGFLFALWKLIQKQEHGYELLFQKGLTYLASDGPVQDDVSAMAIAAPCLDEITLDVSELSRKIIRHQQQAQVEECENTLVYARTQLARLEALDMPNLEAAGRLREVIQRTLSQLQRLAPDRYPAEEAVKAEHPEAGDSQEAAPCCERPDLEETEQEPFGDVPKPEDVFSKLEAPAQEDISSLHASSETDLLMDEDFYAAIQEPPYSSPLTTDPTNAQAGATNDTDLDGR